MQKQKLRIKNETIILAELIIDLAALAQFVMLKYPFLEYKSYQYV
jgi:hypothetical protein